MGISTRQLADAAYRALRVAGVPSGVAADAARDAVELECRHGRGVDLLDRILQSEPRSLLANCQPDRRGTGLDAHGASALLLALPLVALAREPTPSTLAVRELAHCGALEPALRRIAKAEHLRFALVASDGTAVLRADAAECEVGPLWSVGWESPLDVRLSVHVAREPHPGVAEAPAIDRPRIVLDAQKWQRLSERAGRYLV